MKTVYGFLILVCIGLSSGCATQRASQAWDAGRLSRASSMIRVSWQPSGTPATDPFSDDYAGNGDPGLYRRLNPEGDDTPDQRDLHELVTQLRTGDFSTEMRYPFVGFSRQYVLLDDDSNPVALVEIINSNYGFVIRDIIQTADGAYSVTNTIGHVLPIFPIEPTPDDAL